MKIPTRTKMKNKTTKRAPAGTLPKLPAAMPKTKPKGCTMTPSEMEHLYTLSRVKAGMSPREFAKRRWPHSPGWKKECSIGAGPGSAGKFLTKKKGGAMNVTAGAALGKLVKKGWVKKGPSDARANVFTVTYRGAELYKKELAIYKAKKGSSPPAPKKKTPPKKAGSGRRGMIKTS